MDNQREADDHANAELHSELEFRTRRALGIIYEKCYQGGTGALDAADWSALCFACGVGPYDFERKGKR